MDDKQTMPWIDTATKRPPEGCEVLGFWPGREFPAYQRVVVWDGRSWGSPPTDYPRYAYEEPDAWMPLPTPPTPATMWSWLSANASKPASGSAVLGWWPGRQPADDGAAGVALWDGELWVNPEEQDFGYADPDFWMPLPPAFVREHR
jgi:hypothetical protein